ncbi:hypothetical protein [Clostridium pasteurianum]|uniref:Uncharacterized protein n=1 Tax=Clostridium pasteurianum BC1 TaxID=86416 RepID=R4K474_CLOPA|nr:hypothetical protein [Clostridium pasteurianum]AGK97947.1 hypothetical protein Clopa_3132 [Clostridium pasteurianum BC1]
MKRKPNKFLSIGLFIAGIALFLKNSSIPLPDFIDGLLLGSGIGLELIGIYSMNYDISKFRNYKRNLLNKCLNK